MAEANCRKNNRLNFRPQFGSPNHDSSSGLPKTGSNIYSASKPTATIDEASEYAVNLLLKPVEMGIVAKNNQWQQEFKGLGAFNHYFGLLAPANNMGYTLPDIWDGYYHITLAKFSTHLAPERLEENFRKFTPCLQDLPYISDVVFQTTHMNRSSGYYRTRNRRNIEFIVLAINCNPVIKAFYEKVELLLEKIKEQTESTKWYVTPVSKLYVTVRKYSNISIPLNKIRIQEFRLEFRCSHLEVKQTREQAIDRFAKAKNDRYRWWTGVTEIDGKCSGCKAPIMTENWEGFCLRCGKYESLIPIWSTDGNKINNYHQIQLEEQIQNDNTLSSLVQRVNLNES